MAWVELELAEPVKVVEYALTSANDAAGRDPARLDAPGLQNGTDWTTLDTRTNQDFSACFQTKQYSFSNDVAYKYYRLDITANHGDSIIQLAELQLSNGDIAPLRGRQCTMARRRAARGGYNAKSAVGWTGVRALQYAGRHTADDRAYSYNKVFDVDVAVTAATELSYVIYPDFERDDLRYPSTYTRKSAFTDGTRLSELGATDQHGATLSPRQAASKTLYTNQWNLKRRASARSPPARRSTASSSRTTTRTGRGLRRPIDHIDIGPAKPPPTRSHLPTGWSRLGELERELLARQQRPRDRSAARLQLLDPGHSTRARSAGSTSTSGPTTRTTCRRCRRCSATSRARGWATARPSR